MDGHKGGGADSCGGESKDEKPIKKATLSIGGRLRSRVMSLGARRGATALHNGIGTMGAAFRLSTSSSHQNDDTQPQQQLNDQEGQLPTPLQPESKVPPLDLDGIDLGGLPAAPPSPLTTEPRSPGVTDWGRLVVNTSVENTTVRQKASSCEQSAKLLTNSTKFGNLDSVIAANDSAGAVEETMTSGGPSHLAQHRGSEPRSASEPHSEGDSPFVLRFGRFVDGDEASPLYGELMGVRRPWGLTGSRERPSLERSSTERLSRERFSRERPGLGSVDRRDGSGRRSGSQPIFEYDIRFGEDTDDSDTSEAGSPRSGSNPSGAILGEEGGHTSSIRAAKSPRSSLDEGKKLLRWLQAPGEISSPPQFRPGGDLSHNSGDPETNPVRVDLGAAGAAAVDAAALGTAASASVGGLSLIGPTSDDAVEYFFVLGDGGSIDLDDENQAAASGAQVLDTRRSFLEIAVALLGKHVTVLLNDGSSFEATLHTLSSEFPPTSGLQN